MGIVVSLGMVLALWLLWRPTSSQKWMVAVVAALGLWNSAWYGLRHLGEFWGYTALVSGVAMIIAASMWAQSTRESQPAWLASLKIALAVILVSSFLLYAVTIIRLNLGLPILR